MNRQIAIRLFINTKRGQLSDSENLKPELGKFSEKKQLELVALSSKTIARARNRNVESRKQIEKKTRFGF